MSNFPNYLNHLLTFALIVLAAVFLVAIYPPIASFDTYFHLAVGREVALTHQIPKTDSFTFVGAGREWISNEWLAGLIFYETYSNFGETGILALRAILGVITIVFIALTLKLLKIKLTLQLLTLATTVLALSTRMIDRPEMISFLFFSLLIYLLTKYQIKPSLLTLLPIVPIFILWPNIQGYAPIGLAVFAFYVLKVILAEKLDLQLVVEAAKNHRFLILVFTFSLAASLIQFERFLYFLFLNPELFGYVSEVKSVFENFKNIRHNLLLNIPIEIHILFIFTTIGFFSFFVRKNQSPSKATILNFLFVAALCILTLKYSRIIPLFVLLVSPIIAQNLNAYLEGKEKYLQAPIAIIFLIMLFSIYQGKLWGERHNTLYIFDKNNNVKVATSYTWKERRPTAALEFIQKNLAPKKLMTSLNWSNQTLWQLEGKTKVMLDIIYEKQTKESFQDYRLLSQGKGDTEKILEKYDPDVIINTQPLNLAVPFEPPVYIIGHWNLVYVDEAAAVYTRGNAELALSALHPEYAGDLKFKPEEKEKAREQLNRLLAQNSQNAFVRQQLILILLLEKSYKDAQELAVESSKLFPKDPIFYLLLATAQIRKGNCDQTILLLKAKGLAKGYFYLKKHADSLAAQCNLPV